MTNRTVQFYGQGYGTVPAEITATLDGIVVYSGTVPTIDQENYNRMPEDQVLLFTAQVPVDFDGTKPMTISVSNSTVVFAHVLGNYYTKNNPRLEGKTPYAEDATPAEITEWFAQYADQEHLKILPQGIKF